MMTRWMIALTLSCLSCPLARAQSAESDVGEISAFVGGASGIGSHFLTGGSTGIAFSRYALALFDFSYSRFGQDTLRHQPGVEARNSNLYDFNVSAHIRYPIDTKWAPYAILGPSLLLNHYEAGSMQVTRNDVNFGLHAGGGVRYHVNHKWGIKPEIKVVISNQTYVAFSIGVFFTVESLF